MSIGTILESAGAPSAGTSEVQTLTIGGTPTGGTFTIHFEGFTSSAITWSATNNTLLANLQAAIDALPSLGTNGLIAAAGTLTAGIGTITLTAGGNRAKQALGSVLSCPTNALTGTAPTLAVAETTPGVDATARGSGIGTLVQDTATGILYSNTGTALVPVWTKVGAQT